MQCELEWIPNTYSVIIVENLQRIRDQCLVKLMVLTGSNLLHYTGVMPRLI